MKARPPLRSGAAAFMPYPQLFIFLFIFFILYHFRNLAIEYRAKLVYGFRGYRLAVLHAVYGICGYALLVDELVCSHILFEQRFPKWAVGYHFKPLSTVFE
jgi:hypothetical protein